MDSTPFTVALEAASAPGVDELLRLGTEDARSLYPPQHSFLLDADELSRDGVRVFVARDPNELAVAMAALVHTGVPSPGADVELKRMFVRPHARRLGVATGLLETVEADARRTGAGRIVLETGTRSEAAIRLYERCGYLHVPPFGQYVGQPFSVCFAKALG
jgi:putative acetyltransferase